MGLSVKLKFKSKYTHLLICGWVDNPIFLCWAFSLEPRCLLLLLDSLMASIGIEVLLRELR